MSPKFKNIPQPKQARGALAGKAQAQFNEAIALHQQGQLGQAKAIYEGVLQGSPRHAQALHMLGVIATQTKNYQTAIDLINQAIAIDPSDAVSYSNRGNALKELKQYEAAVESYDKAISIKPGLSEAYNNRGIALKELKQYEAAVKSYDQAITLKPNSAEAYYNRGNTLLELMQFEAAIVSLERAISLKPDYAKAYNNRGNALLDLRQLEAAVADFDRSISLKPDFAAAHNNRGNALKELKRLEGAVESYERALSLKPDHEYLFGTLLHTRMNLCDWKDFEAGTAEVIQKICSNAKVMPAFPMLSLTDSRVIQRQAAEIYCQDKHPPVAKPVWSGQRYEHTRIRVAYVSCDFKLHPAALNNMLIWEKHDRDRFEVVAFSYGPVFQEDATPQGQMRSRLIKAFDKFLDVGDKSDEQIAQLMSEMEIDIAVDLSGLTNGGRQGILAYRPAPVQVNFYGFTSGAPYIDYIISDRVTIAPEHQHGYTEKVVYLPDTWLGVDTSRQVSSRQFTRGELGLPEGGVVYCSFNTVYKINPQMFDVWMRILLQVPGSVLWLQGGSQEKVKENLRREAQARGVEPDRLVFAARMESMADHLARHRAADVFLDTLPFNAQTTAADALWAGLPVLTCLGESSFGRVAGSLLMALGMPELVMQDVQAYEAMAVSLGTDAEMVKRLKEKLRQQSQSAPLFEMERMTRHLEQAYEQMHQYTQQEKTAQAIEVG